MYARKIDGWDESNLKDSDWTEHFNDRRLSNGFIFKFAGGIIS